MQAKSNKSRKSDSVPSGTDVVGSAMPVVYSPIAYAQRIIDVLGDIDCGSAKIALRIADALIDQRVRDGALAALAGVREEVRTSVRKQR